MQSRDTRDSRDQPTRKTLHWCNTNADAELFHLLGMCLNAPPNGHGFLAAMRGVEVMIEELVLVRQIPGLTQFLLRLRAARETAINSSPSSQLAAIPEFKSISSAYRLAIDMSERGRSLSGSGFSAEGIAVFGAIYVWHLQLRRRIPESRAYELCMLIKKQSRRSLRGWKALGAALTFDVETLHKATERIYHDGAFDLGRWIGNILDNINGLAVFLPERAGPAPEIQIESKDQDSTTAVGEEPELPRHGDSLVVWQFRRAAKMFGAGTAGIKEWNLLTPEELKPVAKKLAIQLNNDDEFVRHLAACAFLSLATALPIRLVLRLPFSPNGDIWIDTAGGEVVWNIAKIAQRDPAPEEIMQSGHRPESLVYCALPYMVAEVLRKVSSDQPICLERLFPGTPEKLVASRYGELLRQGCDHDSRMPYAARWAYSLGGLIGTA